MYARARRLSDNEYARARTDLQHGTRAERQMLFTRAAAAYGSDQRRERPMIVRGRGSRLPSAQPHNR